MNKVRKYLFLGLTLVLLALVSGCGSTADVEFDDYGNASIDYKFYVSEKEHNDMIKKDSFLHTFDDHLINKYTIYDTTEYKNGSLYYVYKYNYTEPLYNGYNYESIARIGKIGTDELTTYGCLIDTRTKFLSTKEYFKFKKDVFADLTITFKKPIVESNGIITNKGYTVTWTRNDMNNCDFLYAYSDDYLKSRIPWIDVKDEDKTFIKRTSEHDIVSFFSIIPFKSIKENGKDILSKGRVIHKDGVYRFIYKWYEGKHKKIDCLNKNGGFRTKIWVDKTRPKIKLTGKKYNGDYKGKVKITVTDNLSGIYDIRVNNRTVKNGTVINVRGDYTVKAIDKFGNENEAYFKIVK